MRKYVVLTLAIICLGSMLIKTASAQHKSPVTAGLLSTILPGSGQIYNGEQNKAYTFMVAYLSAAAVAIATNPSTWEDDISSGTFFDEFDTGTPTSTKLIFYGSAGVAALALTWSVWDAVKVAKDTRTRPSKYSTNIIPILEPRNQGVLVKASIRF